MYVPRRLEQPPLAFHCPVGLTIIALLAGRRYLHHWIKHECHVHKLQHLPEHCSIREHCASVEQPPRLLSIAPLNSRVRSYRAMWLSLRSTSRACVPPRLEQPPVTFHRPIELTVALASRHVAVDVLGGQIVRASEPRTAAFSIPSPRWTDGYRSARRVEASSSVDQARLSHSPPATSTRTLLIL